MKKIFGCIVLCLIIAGVIAAQNSKTHVFLAPTELKWGPPPPVFEPGAQMAVLSGDPSKAEPFVVRLKVPAGYRVNPHTHPTDEHVTVISGSFGLAMGDKFDAAAIKAAGPGGYFLAPTGMNHYAMAKTASVIQIHANGPFALTYVNPADDPSKRPAKK